MQRAHVGCALARNVACKHATYSVQACVLFQPLVIISVD